QSLNSGVHCGGFFVDSSPARYCCFAIGMQMKICFQRSDLKQFAVILVTVWRHRADSALPIAFLKEYRYG
ncbi:MAG: hypothetical protein OQK61_01380, partial [Ignavibacteriaceae bacterium]|nr:hypothetical protein [Ignavibacteriaceae bacterium]